MAGVGGLEGQATSSTLALLQIPPAGASDGMRIGVLLPVFAPIVGSRVLELPWGGARVPLAVGIAVVAILLARLGGVSARGEGGRDSDRQQADDDNSHERFPHNYTTQLSTRINIAARGVSGTGGGPRASLPD